MRIAFALPLLLLALMLRGQQLPQNQFNTLFPAKMWDRPVLDSAISVSRLSLESCYQLIEKMFVVDQQYRDSAQRYRTDEDKNRYFGHLWMVNDPVNQTILLKILKKYGWPCESSDRKMSFKAWFIAWHARGDFDRMMIFYPYLVAADRKRCINHNQFVAFKERVDLMKSVRE